MSTNVSAIQDMVLISQQIGLSRASGASDIAEKLQAVMNAQAAWLIADFRKEEQEVRKKSLTVIDGGLSK